MLFVLPSSPNRCPGTGSAAGFAWADVIVAVAARNDEVEAEQLAARLLAAPERPDTVIAMSDQQAAGVVRAVRTAGLSIPQEVAVTGWDDAPVAKRLGLTTVAQSLRDQGAACARAALAEDVELFTGSWTIVQRGSTRT